MRNPTCECPKPLKARAYGRIIGKKLYACRYCGHIIPTNRPKPAPLRIVFDNDTARGFVFNELQKNPELSKSQLSAMMSARGRTAYSPRALDYIIQDERARLGIVPKLGRKPNPGTCITPGCFRKSDNEGSACGKCEQAA